MSSGLHGNEKKASRKYGALVKTIKANAEASRALSDAELAGKTAEFKARIEGGESLSQLLPEAFGVACEADRRVLGMFPYDVQIMAGIALHEGYLAEMNTGEGKTLVATMPLYLNALEGKGAILVTTNEYLATRDAAQMGQVYRFLGLTIMAGVSENPEKHFNNAQKKNIYAADIVYTTHAALGFDYLFNNLVTSAQEKFMRGLHYVIVDEADSVLLDSAQMPLVISGAPRVTSNLYELTDFFVTLLREGKDYEREEQKVWLTVEGVRKAERYFQIDNFYGERYFDINRHVILALRAHVLFKKGKDYTVSDGQILLLDGESGRMMPGVKLRGGQHQALEMKEHLSVTRENRSVAAITYQNLFLLFDKMAGMSGTISDAASELLDVYHKEVLVIPTNKPRIRKDLPDLYYDTAKAQVMAALTEIRRTHESGQPVLVVVPGIPETQMISKLLVAEAIPHNVLNANNAFWEAQIIKDAGQINAVTVATSMAGRGTDIKLGEGVEELGGLCVIGIGRMMNVRQERQARGRAGRQGDPGESRFYVSLQDDVVLRHGPTEVQKKLAEGKQFHAGRVRKVVGDAQRLCEETGAYSRKQALAYDEVMREQRNLIYKMRDDLLEGGTLPREKILAIAQENIEAWLLHNDGSQLTRYVMENLTGRLKPDMRTQLIKQGRALAESVNGAWKEFGSEKELVKTRQLLTQIAWQGLDAQRAKFANDQEMNDFIRRAVLHAIDDAWVEEVDYLQQMQSAVQGRRYAQLNPIFEFRKVAFEAFTGMEVTIKQSILRNILLSQIYVEDGKTRYAMP